MRIPPPGYVRIQQAYRRGDHVVVLAEGDAVAAALNHTAANDDLAREVSAMIGAVHAGQERFAAACTYLEYGLARPEPGGRPDETRDYFDLVLLDCYLRLGRFDDALARVSPLLEPERSLQTRFTATRVQSAVALARADYETAHFLLNTATGLALRIRSRFRGALIEGDRAVLLATQGRLYEGIDAADRVISPLSRPPIGEYQRWGNSAATTIALTIARLAANAGDQLSAQRLLIQGTTAAERADSTYVRAQLALTRGAFAAEERRYDDAEARLFEAHQLFNLLGTAPASALTTLEQGRLAHRRGLMLSAKPLYERALLEFRAVGQPREINETRRLLAALDRQLADLSS